MSVLIETTPRRCHSDPSRSEGEEPAFHASGAPGSTGGTIPDREIPVLICVVKDLVFPPKETNASWLVKRKDRLT